MISTTCKCFTQIVNGKKWLFGRDPRTSTLPRNNCCPGVGKLAASKLQHSSCIITEIIIFVYQCNYANE